MAKRVAADGCPCRLHDGAECRRLAAAGLAVLCEVEVAQAEEVCSRVPGLTAKRMDKVLALIDKDGPGGCWLFSGSLGGRSVPRVSVRNKNMSVTRVVWALEGGEELLPGDALRRTCGNVRCVNPAHMMVVKKGTRVVH